jgi:hypothetical protein
MCVGENEEENSHADYFRPKNVGEISRLFDQDLIPEPLDSLIV